MTWLPQLLIGAGYIILIVAYWQYIKMIKDAESSVVPNPASWTVFSGISGGNAIVLWGSISLNIWAFPIIMGIAQLLIARESYKKRKSHLESADKWAIGVGLFGVGLWIYLEQTQNIQHAWMPIATLLVADGVGFWPTLRDAWKRPHEDDPVTWAIFMLVGGLVLGGLALQSTTKPLDIAYPGYELALASSVFFTLIIRRRWKSSVAWCSLLSGDFRRASCPAFFIDYPI
jgi:hypothetical protein